jgi:hypothetical protein
MNMTVSKRSLGTGPVDHIAFNGVDYEATKARITALGIVPTENHVPSFNIRQLFLIDPNGIKIEINISTTTIS